MLKIKLLKPVKTNTDSLKIGGVFLINASDAIILQKLKIAEIVFNRETPNVTSGNAKTKED